MTMSIRSSRDLVDKVVEVSLGFSELFQATDVLRAILVLILERSGSLNGFTSPPSITLYIMKYLAPTQYG